MSYPRCDRADRKAVCDSCHRLFTRDAARCEILGCSKWFCQTCAQTRFTCPVCGTIYCQDHERYATNGFCSFDCQESHRLQIEYVNERTARDTAYIEFQKSPELLRTRKFYIKVGVVATLVAILFTLYIWASSYRCFECNILATVAVWICCSGSWLVPWCVYEARTCSQFYTGP